ncbi:MAG: branched-chain amino acid ABC transporter permease [Sneathiella sp.]|jgi:branched-chain amino acid transport system permease protein|uniref:branched-chain amino acid ABC transporter permease n=1 Tax=Sneathiella sp. TaxID=1964365 RepID=UPI000C689528|nr:branched-chain amino acid ABC transporter permease [Sneathiella sp.]MAL77714.1 branched-chain amino acid ABC transporter permease [Sneathiella sp.]
MRFLFKTDYNQDIRIAKHSGYYWSYGVLLLLVLAAPLLLDSYYIGQMTQLYIVAIAGLGLMLLAGYTGLVSLGHAAFFGIGAYTEAVLTGAGLQLPFMEEPLVFSFVVAMPLAAIFAGIAGVVIGIPVLRLTGIYLAIATFAFAIVIEEVMSRWESVTNGYTGLLVDSIYIGDIDFSSGEPFYFLCLGLLILVILFSINLLRSPTGRAMMAIRDSEISAQSMGVNLARVKTTAFGISAGITGLAGALFAHKLGFLSPESFTVLQSLEFLVLVVVGGIGSIHGAIFGAMFVLALPQALAIAKDYVPPEIGEMPGIEPFIFGLILVLVIIFEPYGIYGRWLKVKHYFQMFPIYKKATFKRQKAYMKSERLK